MIPRTIDVIYIFFWKFRVFILLSIIITLTSCNRLKYLVRKSILLRTLSLYKKFIIFDVRLNPKGIYERSLKCI